MGLLRLLSTNPADPTNLIISPERFFNPTHQTTIGLGRIDGSPVHLWESWTPTLHPLVHMSVD